MQDRIQLVKGDQVGLLNFTKPKQILPPEEYIGTYVPNMSVKNMRKWKAKKIGGNDPRIEIRKSIEGFDPIIEKNRVKRGWGGNKTKTNCSAQILLIVRPDASVVMSANGRMAFDEKHWKELQEARQEAIQELLKK